jgi:tripartite-type tricarboxylate transporter receptor subunit TctC
MNAKTALAAVAAVMAAAGAIDSAAQQYPLKPVRMIVPFAPGGSTDIMGRLVGQQLNEVMGQQFVVDNRGGAGTMIGTELAAKSPPDGYTLLLTNVAFAIIPGLHGKRLPYDPHRGFEPVTLIASQPTVLAVHPSLPVRSVQDLIRLARQKPGQLSYASSGSGGIGHIAGEMFKLMSGVDLTHVPYKGGGPAVVDLMAGQVMLAFVGMPTAMAHARAGKLKFIAVTDGRRAAAEPNLPTVAESGLKDYQVENWIGLLAPGATPQPVVAQLHDGMAKVLARPEIRGKLESLGFDVVGKSPAEFRALLERDIRAFARVIADAKIQAN